MLTDLFNRILAGEQLEVQSQSAFILSHVSEIGAATTRPGRIKVGSRIQ